MANKTYEVPFMVGDGTGLVMLRVKYIAKYPRGDDEYGTCAFCKGDPCAEYSPPDSLIAQYFARNKKWAQTCPCCNGQPT